MWVALTFVQNYSLPTNYYLLVNMAERGEIIVKRAPAPAELPIYDSKHLEDVTYFGRTNYTEAFMSTRYIFGIKRTDRRRHMYVIGKSGMGKSKCLELLIRPDIYYGKGICVIDPHGDLIQSLLDFIPPERVQDIILIDPSDLSHPVAFNPLAGVTEEFKHQVTEGLVEIFKKIFAATWTPRLEHVFRFTALAMLDYPGATIYGMLKLLTDREFRQRVIPHITDDVVRRFWSIEFAAWSDRFETEAIIPLVSRLGQFLANPLVRHIFGQRENKIDFYELMNQQKIILINLSKGKLGEENSELFGSIFVTKINQAAMARSRLPERERKEFYFYVDEFQSVATRTFLNLFSESRKYGINITIAHQYLGQLTQEMQDTIFGNVGTIVSFRTGADDAARLEKEFAPIFAGRDVINLGIREMYLKMSIDGRTYDPFSADVIEVKPTAYNSSREAVVALAREKFCRPVAIVRDEIKNEELSDAPGSSTGSAPSKNPSSGTEPKRDEPPPPLV